MPDIILPGPAGRIEVRYQRQKTPNAPMALVLHPHPQFGGTMNNPLVYDLFHMFHKLGCTAVRFNFRGVGRSQGTFDSGAGELSDAAAVLDWMNTLYPNPSSGKMHISYTLDNFSDVRVELYNLLGEKLRIVSGEKEEAGRHEHEYDLSGLPAASYFLKIEINSNIEIKLIEIVR